MKMFSTLLLIAYTPLYLVAGCCDSKNCCTSPCASSADCCADQDHCLISCAPKSDCCSNGDDCCSKKEFSSVEHASDKNNPVQELVSKAALEKAIKDHAVVVVDFHATWCGPCCQQDPILRAVAVKYKNVYFVKLDIDEEENKTLIDVYGIERIPMQLFFKNGVLKKSVTGIQQEAQFQAILDDMLK